MIRSAPPIWSTADCQSPHDGSYLPSVTPQKNVSRQERNLPWHYSPRLAAGAKYHTLSTATNYQGHSHLILQMMGTWGAIQYLQCPRFPLDAAQHHHTKNIHLNGLCNQLRRDWTLICVRNLRKISSHHFQSLPIESNRNQTKNITTIAARHHLLYKVKSTAIASTNLRGWDMGVRDIDGWMESSTIHFSTTSNPTFNQSTPPITARHYPQ